MSALDRDHPCAGLYGQLPLSYQLSTKMPRRTNLPLRNPG
jgi:hypothetical protein